MAGVRTIDPRHGDPVRLAERGAAVSAAAPKSRLLADLKSKVAALGLGITSDDVEGFTGQLKAIRAKWPLGARAITYRMSCRLDEAGRTVHFREAVTEASWGMPPPTFMMEWTVLKGWGRSGVRIDRWPGGAGTINQGQVREQLKQMASAAGWEFHLDGGGIP